MTEIKTCNMYIPFLSTNVSHIESEQAKMPLLFTFMHNIDCVQFVIHATNHGNQTI